MIKLHTLHMAILSALAMFTMPQEPSATPNPEAISPETLAAMPDKDSPVPVGRNWTLAGTEHGQLLLAAEQGIQLANQNAEKCKIDGLIELCQHDDTARAQFIGGVDNAFRTKDGDKLTKAHQNYMADLRRVSNALKEGMGAGDLVKALETKGTYAQKMEKVPRASKRGGSNRGTGAGAVQEQVTQAIQQHGAEAVNAAVQALNQPPIETPTKAPTHAEFTSEQLAAAIAGCHANQVEVVFHAVAARGLLTDSPMFQELGKFIQHTLNQAEQREAQEAPAKIAA